METAHDTERRNVLERDDLFFDALLTVDRDTLEELLTLDFVIVDVLGGQVAGREDLLGAIGAGAIEFAEVTRFPAERGIRDRDCLAVVVGRTRMVIRHPAGEAAVASRYTHVFVHESGAWRLMSAQGTPIPEAAP